MFFKWVVLQVCAFWKKKKFSFWLTSSYFAEFLSGEYTKHLIRQTELEEIKILLHLMIPSEFHIRIMPQKNVDTPLIVTMNMFWQFMVAYHELSKHVHCHARELVVDDRKYATLYCRHFCYCLTEVAAMAGRVFLCIKEKEIPLTSHSNVKFFYSFVFSCLILFC